MPMKSTGGRQVGGQFRGKQAMHTDEGFSRHRDVFAQHFADEKEGAARVIAGTEGGEFTIQVQQLQKRHP